MAFEQRDNNGSLFKNEKKTDGKHPDYKGSAMVDGVEYWLSAWIKQGKSGVKFMSIALQPKEDRAVESKSSKKEEESSEDMPF